MTWDNPPASRHWREGLTVCPTKLNPDGWVKGTFRHVVRSPFHTWYYGRCLNCSAHYSETLEGDLTVPGLSQVLGAKAESTWAEQVEKESIERQNFWIHDVKPTEYVDENDRNVSLLVLDITLNDASRKGPRAVITLGRSEEREGLLAYFRPQVDANGLHVKPDISPDPIGPCITYKVGLKGSRTFWVLEEAPNPEDTGEMFTPPNRRSSR